MLAVGVDRVDPAPGEARGPAVLAEARDAAWRSRPGRWPASTGRIRFAAWWIVSPSGMASSRRRRAAMRSGAQRELARAGAEAHLDEQRLPVGADDRLAVDALEREPPRAAAA